MRQGRAKVFRKIQNKDFIVASTLEAGGRFGFNHDRYIALESILSKTKAMVIESMFRSHKSQEIIDLDENR